MFAKDRVQSTPRKQIYSYSLRHSDTTKKMEEEEKEKKERKREREKKGKDPSGY